MCAQTLRSKIVCECLGTTEAEIISAITAQHLSSVRQVTACTQAGDGCTACHPAIARYLSANRARQPRSHVAVSTYGAHSPNFSAR